MKKVAVIYWSGTGNTQAMARFVADGAKEAGAQVELLTPGECDAALLDSMDAIAFGCPAMGAEVLEESEFEPLFAACEPRLAGKRIALFGSYGWGDGEWMRNWEARCADAGAQLVCDGIICADAPDQATQARCREAGNTLAS